MGHYGSLRGAVVLVRQRLSRSLGPRPRHSKVAKRVRTSDEAARRPPVSGSSPTTSYDALGSGPRSEIGEVQCDKWFAEIDLHAIDILNEGVMKVVAGPREVQKPVPSLVVLIWFVDADEFGLGE